MGMYYVVEFAAETEDFDATFFSNSAFNKGHASDPMEACAMMWHLLELTSR